MSNETVKIIVDVREASDIKDVDNFVSWFSWEETINNPKWQSCPRYTFSFREIGEDGRQDSEKGHRYHCVAHHERLYKGRR
jgi:hypothetical protein